MLPSHIGNGDPRLRGFLHDPRLLIDGIPSTTLDIRTNLNSLCIRRHGGLTWLTPSSYFTKGLSGRNGAAPVAAFAPNMWVEYSIVTYLKIGSSSHTWLGVSG